MYWNIHEILPYQKNFNFINGPRSIGKSYTTQKFVLRKCLEKGLQFVYITRTIAERKEGVFKQAFEKVCVQEFPDYSFEFTSDVMTNPDDGAIIGYCIALTEAQKKKKPSYPQVKYIIFDEYMLEMNNSGRYVNGWREPDTFLSLYHTIDREEDRVICFLLGNNTSFFNPYHMHPAFSIPEISPGGIWYSKNVLYQWALPSEELKEEKAKSKFIQMIEGTSYSQYAVTGSYIEDNRNFVEVRTSNARHLFYFEYMGARYGVWYDANAGRIFIDYKYDPSCRMAYALTLADHTENTTLTQGKKPTLLEWLGQNFKRGNVRYVNMAVKKMAEQAIVLIL